MIEVKSFNNIYFSLLLSFSYIMYLQVLISPVFNIFTSKCTRKSYMHDCNNFVECYDIFLKFNITYVISI